MALLRSVVGAGDRDDAARELSMWAPSWLLLSNLKRPGCLAGLGAVDLDDVAAGLVADTPGLGRRWVVGARRRTYDECVTSTELWPVPGHCDLQIRATAIFSLAP